MALADSRSYDSGRTETGPIAGDVIFDRARIYADIFDQLGDGLIVTRLDGTIIDWNPGAERMFGWTRHEAVGQTPAMFLDPHTPELVDSILGEINGRGG